MNINEDLKSQVCKLGLFGVAEQWNEYGQKSWINDLIKVEQEYRQRRSLHNRMRTAKLEDFKPLCEFDWAWPKKIDRYLIEELLTLGFMDEKANVALVGSNGVGKTLIAKNIGFEAIRRGKNCVFYGATQMLTWLSKQESEGTLSRALKRLSKPDLLVIDEIGQVSFGNRHADLLFAVVNSRYQKKSTIITTNTAFSQWGDLFPNATCVVTLVDRLLHIAEIIDIEGESFRLRESIERQERKLANRNAKKQKNS